MWCGLSPQKVGLGGFKKGKVPSRAHKRKRFLFVLILRLHTQTHTRTHHRDDDANDQLSVYRDGGYDAEICSLKDFPQKAEPHLFETIQRQEEKCDDDCLFGVWTQV